MRDVIDFLGEGHFILCINISKPVNIFVVDLATMFIRIGRAAIMEMEIDGDNCPIHNLNATREKGKQHIRYVKKIRCGV